jgi:uncharacterized protein YjbI with pentapeptide repeats
MPRTSEPIAPADPDIGEDLPDAELPEALSEAEISGSGIAAGSHPSIDATAVRIADSRISDVDFADGEFARCSITDVIWVGGTLANVSVMNSNLRRVRFSDVRATGVNLAGATLEDVCFVSCRLDLSNLRMAKLERVRFESCRMEEADFYQASLRSVVFDDCTLTGANWSGATFERSEMRGSDLSGADGLESIRGVRMPWSDVVRSANEIARAAGIEVID